MDQVMDIPIIARGRVIMPGDDAVTFKGRGGADFRQADQHRHIHDLVLGDRRACATCTTRQSPGSSSCLPSLATN